MVTATNLLGMALGPLISGALSDRFDLQTALLIVSFVPLLAAACYTAAGLLYSRKRLYAEEEAQLSFGV
jgi:MFS family permease